MIAYQLVDLIYFANAHNNFDDLTVNLMVYCICAELIVGD